MTDRITSGSGAGHSIVISPDDTSISLAQAIYHHITTKTERVLETFRESYIVSESDIIQLSHALKQVAQRHHEDEWSCVVDHSIFKKSRTRYSSLERFRLADKGQSDPTGEIVVTYDFLSKNPFTPQTIEIMPERYKVVIRVTQEPYLSLLDEEDSRPSFITRLVSFPSITASIQYVDYTVARAILSAVKEWVESLDTCKKSRLSKFFMKNEFSLHGIIPATLAACTLIGASGVAFHVENTDWGFAFSALALAVIFFGLGSLVAESLMNNLYTLQSPTVILITRGDKINQTAIKNRRSRAKKAVGLLLCTVLLAIAINVFSSFLYQWIIA